MTITIGVFNKYMTQVQGQRNFTLINVGMTEDKGYIFVEHTIGAVVHR